MPVATRMLQGLTALVGGAAVAVLLLEVSLHLLPVSGATAAGYYIDPLILTYPAQHSFTMATGWDLQNAQREHTNNFGFIASRDFRPDPSAVAVIGDSFVEASMLRPADRIGPLLEARLDDRPVYAMGMPGSALLDYAERMRFAAEQFGVHDFVVLLERGDVAQSLCGSGNIHGPCLDRATLEPRTEKQGPPGALKRVLRNSALAQYLFSQLKLDPVAWLRQKLAREPTASAPPRNIGQASDDAAERVVTEFFTRTRAYRSGRMIFVLLGTPGPGRDQLTNAAAAEQSTIIEAEPLLRDCEARTGWSMRVSPQDAHLNRIALDVLAAAAARALGGSVDRPDPCIGGA